MRTLRVSVRRLVEFLLRSGDIDAGTGGQRGIEAMLAGSDIHRRLQASAGDAYQAELPLAASLYFPGGAFSPHAARLDIPEDAVQGQDGFFLAIEGRADGVIDDGTHPLTIDEIKGVSRDVSALDQSDALHEAQALCYAYLYLRGKRGPQALATAHDDQVVIRVTYASMTTGELRAIERTYTVPDVEAWFFSLLAKAERWAAWRVRHDELRDQTLAALEFPFAPRGDQRAIMDAVSAAIREGRRLYLQAPTGSGKTVATLFPALKAVGSGEASRIAYLTAKTTTRQAALECLELLRSRGLAASALAMTARDKICPLRRGKETGAVRARPLASLCNPVECPRARGHYDAVNDALYEAISTQSTISSDQIEELAARHHVCPYELQRDAARWVDVIVCDYHYAFAPSASLLGLADEPGGDTVYLVDEAHNLAERMREMYSAELTLGELEGLSRLLRGQDGLEELAQAVRAVIAAFPAWDKALPAGKRAGRQGRDLRAAYQVVRIREELRASLTALDEALSAALELLSPLAGDAAANGRRARASGAGMAETYLALRDAKLWLLAFLGALERAEAGYVSFLSRAEDGGRKLVVFCLNPRHDLDERLKQAKAAAFFSGTLLPLDYHRRLLAARDDDPSLYARSGFDPRHRQVLIATDVSARYARRGPELYARIASYLVALTRACPGNHLVFLPSYAMLGEVAQRLEPLAGREMALERQRPGMREAERERFVARFRTSQSTSQSLVGLCVLGGIFGEGIDLPGDALRGVVVVGTGMPWATPERELISDYFDAKEGKGFAYAYTYPGMVKVLQAAGRLIRSEEDRGVVLLLDDRFAEPGLRATFPQEWEDVRTCTLETLPKLLRRV